MCNERIFFSIRIYVYVSLIICSRVSVRYSKLLILIKSLAHYYLYFPFSMSTSVWVPHMEVPHSAISFPI